MNSTLRTKINIFGSGIILSLMGFGMIEVVYAVITSSNYINDLIDSEYMLVFIIFSLQSISFIISILVSIRFSEDIKYLSIFKNVGWSYFMTNVILISISYLFMIIYFPNVFSRIIDFGSFVGVFPQVLINFSIYILPHPFFLFVLTILIYYTIYVLSYDNFYESKFYKNKEYKSNYIKKGV